MVITGKITGRKKTPPVIITQNGEPKAVLQDPESYGNMGNAINVVRL
ncbi:MAG: type II toxin-antitoxin system prevent-host-death family antitoxin [Candidatus Anammoxibacter sp.]